MGELVVPCLILRVHVLSKNSTPYSFQENHSKVPFLRCAALCTAVRGQVLSKSK